MDTVYWRRSEEVYLAILESIAEGVAVLDDQGIVLDANTRLAPILGVDSSLVLGRSFAELFDLDARNDVARLIATSGENANVAECSIAPRGEGVKRTVSVMTRSWSASSSKYEGSLVVVTDLTERKRAVALERQFERTRRLDSLGQLAGGIAHDFNNVLSVTLTNAQLLVDDLEPGSASAEDAERIVKAATRGQQLTKRLLTFSRGEVSQPRPTAVEPLLNQVIDMLKRTITSAIEVRLRYGDSHRVLLDPAQFEEAVINLVGNATEAMPDGGILTIETDSVRLAASDIAAAEVAAPGEYVRLSVSDTGLGMSPEVRDRALEPLFTTKRAGSGTGLGLSSVYGVVTQAGGILRLYSEEGVGTSVKLFIPLTEASDAKVEQAPAQPTIDRAMDFILVDDSPELVHSVGRSLRADGHRVKTFTDPRVLLDFAETQPEMIAEIDVLITDVVMPGVSGPELVRRLRESSPPLRVVYISGYTAGMLESMDTFPDSNTVLVDKPFTKEVLLRAVALVVKSEPTGTPES
jgi:two-component system cell cycle sensor histidine kinase/response regulator CckA